MPAHIFKHTDLIPLEQNPLQGNYAILIVGTFNADVEGHAASWFYGRSENEFWSLFPRMLGFPGLHPVDRDDPIAELTQLWKNFCADNSIVIVDIFKDIFVDLPNHADLNLQNLQEDEYTLFDFRTAFQYCHFDKVLFTWKGMRPNTLTTIKTQYIEYFANQQTDIGHLLTPSLAYSKPRSFKLAQWKNAYNGL